MIIKSYRLFSCDNKEPLKLGLFLQSQKEDRIDYYMDIKTTT